MTEVEEFCPYCSEEMDVYDSEKTRKHFDDPISNDEETSVMWKPSDCESCNFLFCPECKIIRVYHVPEEVFLTLVGHMGFAQDGSEHMRNSKTGTKVVLEDPKPIKNLKEPRFDVSDLGQQKLKGGDWFPCGPNEDMPHFWFCPSTQKQFVFSRK